MLSISRVDCWEHVLPCQESDDIGLQNRLDFES